MVSILGIDPSLTATGLAVLTLGPPGYWVWETLEVAKTKLKGHQRIEHIRRRLLEALKNTDDGDLIVIEGPSFGSRGPGHHEIAGLWWILRHDIYALQSQLGQRRVAIVPPKTRAMYAASSGNADKNSVLESVRTRFPEEDVTDHNIADAMIFATMGARWLGREVDEVNEKQLSAMDKVRWPDGL